MADGKVIEIKGLNFSYDGALVLEDINLTVERQDFVAVIGPNGGGKTTLLKVILGLLKPVSGTVTVFGKPPAQVRTRMGYTPQSFLADQKFPVNVLDVVLLGRLGKTRPVGPYSRKDKSAADEALREVDILPMRSRPFSAISGGQRQRVLIARALVGGPELLLLDEPTANLDIHMEQELYALLSELNKRLTIVMVSHDVGVVSTFVKTVVCVKRRAVVHPTSDLSGEIVSDMYGGKVRAVRHDQIFGEGGGICPIL